MSIKTALLALHILGGSVGVITGFASLFVGKGSTLHRRAGQVFVGAMVTMGLTGAIMGNVVGGLLASYLVVTAFTTLRPISRRAGIALMLAAATMGSLMLIDGVNTIAQGKTSKDGVPVAMTLFLTTIMFIAVAGDFRLLRAGGVIRGSQRIVRHLWRMCFSLFIASGSFFTIRKRVAVILPEPFLDFRIRLIPVVLPLLAIGYWVWRIKFRKRFKPVRIADPLNA
jgi:hypothetical protein